MVIRSYSSVSRNTGRPCPREYALEDVRDGQELDVVCDREGIVWARPNGGPLIMFGRSFSVASALSLSLVDCEIERTSTVMSCTDPLGVAGFDAVGTGDGAALV